MVSAILLAAGTSSRMGEQNKLLLPVGQEPFIRRVARYLTAASVGEIIVVTGHQEEDIKQALEGMQLQFVHNPGYLSGMTGSIQQGVLAATGDYMICLGDMIFIEPDEYRLLIDTFHARLTLDPRCICIPTYLGSKGNPVVFAASYRDELLAHKDPEGCKGIVQANQAHLKMVPFETPHTLRDIDYPADYDKLLNA